MKGRVIAGVILVAIACSMAGCTGGIGQTSLEPKLSPPVIARPGVLRAVVDPTYPPFAGRAGETTVGLDVDIAAAIAEQLGLRLELMNGTPAQGAALIQAGTADLVLGGLTVEQAVNSQLAFAGTYGSDGPALFAAIDSTVTAGDLSSRRVAVQKGSAAYWILVDQYGEDNLVPVSTLRDAMSAVASGTADVAAGDAYVGAYLLRDFPVLSFKAQLGSGAPIGIGVSMEKPRLESEIRAILDKLSSEGVLDTLRHKWVGDLPVLVVTGPSAESSSTPSTATPDATATK